MTRLEIISDVICPWCYLGAANLLRAIAEHPTPNLELHWRPYQLDPTIPREGIDREQYFIDKFGSLNAVAPMHERLNAMAEEAGIVFDFARIARTPNSLDAHRVLHWAEAEGVQTPLMMGLFRRLFEYGEDISDPEVLCAAAADAGLDGDVIGQLLLGTADRDAILAEAEAARASGVTGVPTFILAGQYALAGAQPAETWAGVMSEIAAAGGVPTSG